MAATTPVLTDDPTLQLDELLFEICEELQLSPSRYREAQARYLTLSEVLASPASPFTQQRPRIYPQGSMRLGTTVHPLKGPFDLDFVMQLSLSHTRVNPMTLLMSLFHFLKQHGTYRSMVTLKKRCVRIEYANEFYMDILPACLDTQKSNGCIKVPDRQTQEWIDSNPGGFADWFARRARLALLKPELQILAKTMPVPDQKDVDEKHPLQLVVQLLKRWRDIYYKASPDLAPISIVLTTLAAESYDGDDCINASLMKTVSRICDRIWAAERVGQRLQVRNPANSDEILSERWDANPAAYEAFKEGMRSLKNRWGSVLAKTVNVNTELENLFGETVQAAILKQARRVAEARRSNSLRVLSSGIITSAANAIPMKRNSFHGAE
jgi:hypothetical protein